jgi:hypothetical protein
MAGNDLYQVFLEAAGQQSGDLGGVRYALEEVIAQLGMVQQTTAQQAKAATQARSTSTDSGGSESTLVQVLKSGLGLAPVIGGLIGLFSGGGSDAPAPLVKYALPTAVNIAAADTDGQITAADYGQAGMARAYPAPGGGSATQQGAQITVNVQAMDARSFLDRSGDIASAVRDAMLNLNSINDVVNDL